MKKNKEVDYQAELEKSAPNPANIRRGLKALQEKREVGKTKITIRIDENIVQQFKQMAPEGRGYQSLMNQALLEWLAAQNVKELLRQEMAGLVTQALSSIQAATTASK